MMTEGFTKRTLIEYLEALDIPDDAKIIIRVHTEFGETQMMVVNTIEEWNRYPPNLLLSSK